MFILKKIISFQPALILDPLGLPLLEPLVGGGGVDGVMHAVEPSYIARPPLTSLAPLDHVGLPLVRLAAGFGLVLTLP